MSTIVNKWIWWSVLRIFCVLTKVQSRRGGLCYLNASVGCISYSLQQGIELWIESDGESTVDYSTWNAKRFVISNISNQTNFIGSSHVECVASIIVWLCHEFIIMKLLTIDVCSKVNFADIIVAQYGGVSCVWGVVGSTVVNWAAGGEGQTSLQPIFFDELPGAVFQLLTAESNTKLWQAHETVVRPDNTSRRWLFSCFHFKTASSGLEKRRVETTSRFLFKWTLAGMSSQHLSQLKRAQGQYFLASLTRCQS